MENKFPDRTGKSSFIDGIDLTPSIQKGVDFTKVKEAGFKFVIIQCSRYSGTPELAYDKYAEAATKAGLAVGGYHFAACDTDPVAQAKFFLRQLKRTGIGLRPGDMPPFMDLEYAKLTLKDKGPEYVVKWGVTFMETLQAEMQALHLKNLPGWYTFPNFGESLNPFLGKSKLAHAWLFWLARYAGNKAPQARFYPRDGQTPTLVPKGVLKPILWQYSGNGGYPVPGVPGDCDRNVFLGSQADFDAFRGLDRPAHKTEHDCHEDVQQRPSRPGTPGT